jgi:hypothetical protein
LYATWIIRSAAGTGSTGVMTSRSVDNGATFSPALSVPELPAAGESTSAVAARATAGAVWFAWRIGEALYVARSLDGATTLNPPELITEAAASDGIGLDAIVGPAADTWVTWVTRQAAGTPGDVQLAKLDGAGAAATSVNVSSDTGDSDWPRVRAVGDGAAMVVWQDTAASSGVSDVLATCRLAR